jgi:4'-phosphopantetheinyl transferase
VHLEATDQVLAAFSRLLTPAETVKAGRFRFEHLRRSWVLARGALRLLLGAYLSIDPADIRLRFGTRGKPELDMPGDIAFNLSHSGAMALFGFTQNVEIGVDIEHVHPVGDMLGIARRFYCKEETSDLMSLDPAGQEAAFFHCWTRKEAYLKAIGEGLYEPLNGFRVSLGPDEPARIVHIGNSVTAAAEWSLHDISCIPEYAGALAYRGAPRPVTMLRQISPAELLGRFSRFADLQSEGFRF